MATEKSATALKGLKDLRARIVSQERERTRTRLPGSTAVVEGESQPTDDAGVNCGAMSPCIASNQSKSMVPQCPTEPDHEGSEEVADETPPIVGASGESLPFKAQPDPGKVGEQDQSSEPHPSSQEARETEASVEVSISPAWRSLLAKHCVSGGWSEETLLPLLVEETLRARQPSVRMGGQLLATADSFRSIHCPPGAAIVTLKSDQGCFQLQPKPTSPRMAHWRRHYELMGHPPSEAKRAACRRTLLELTEQLRSATDFRVGSWTKIISTQDFDVVRQAAH